MWINDSLYKAFFEVNDVTALKSNTKCQIGQLLILLTPGKKFTQYLTCDSYFIQRETLYCIYQIFYYTKMMRYITYLPLVDSFRTKRLFSWRRFLIMENIKNTPQIKPEAVIQRCSINKVFLEISQNSHENICSKVSFLIKLQPSGLQGRHRCVLLWICAA